MKTAIDVGDREFLQALHQQGAASIQDLCDREGVTATAVRQRLSRLIAAGLVARETVRASRGRPYHQYRVTAQCEQQLGENYAELATVLWRELGTIPDPQVRDQVRDRIAESLIQRYGQGVSGGSLPDRLDGLKKSLTERGFSVELEQVDGQTVLRETNCPYMELAIEDESICELEQRVFEKILGTPLQVTRRCRDGHRCCEFVPVSSMTLTSEPNATASGCA